MKRIFLPVLAAAVAAIAATGPATAQPKKELVLLTNASADFWTIASRGIEKAQKELPQYKMDMVLPSDFSAAGQRAVLDTLVARGVAGISISVVDAAHFTDEFNSVAAKTCCSPPTATRRNRSALPISAPTTSPPGSGRRGDQKGVAEWRQNHAVRWHHGRDNARERVNGIKKTMTGTVE